MKKSLYFITGNERKVGEAKLACDPIGIEVIQKKVKLNEIQSNNPKEVSRNKATEAYKIIGEPLVVTDTFWDIPALNGFPGAYMSDVVGWFNDTDFINLMKNKKDKTIKFSENITYIDSDGIKEFSKEFTGSIVQSPRGNGNSIENVAEFNGVTLGERREQGGYSHPPEDYVWIEFANWYIKK